VAEEQQSAKTTTVEFLLSDTLPVKEPIIVSRKRQDGGFDVRSSF
jgi:hypothetical protein